MFLTLKSALLFFGQARHSFASPRSAMDSASDFLVNFSFCIYRPKRLIFAPNFWPPQSTFGHFFN